MKPETLHTTDLILYPLPFHSAPNAQWTIMRAHDYHIIGSCGLIGIDEYAAEVWYTIARGWRGHGFANQALNALLAYGFETLMLHTIDAVILEHNTASHAVALNAGMHHLALLKNQWYEYQKLHNVLVYRLAACDYRKR